MEDDQEGASSVEPQLFVTAFARGLAVIRAFGPERPHPTLSDVAKVTGLPRATVRRCLHTLVELGYAESNGRFFSLTPKILTLGYSYLSASPLPRLAQPFLERVSERSHESCSLSILDGEEIVYVARSATRRIMSVDLAIGSRLPAFCTSMGRVLLAALPAEELQRRLGEMKLTRYTRHTVTEHEALLPLLDAAREQGYAIADQELEEGLRSLAVPVFGAGGKVVAAMNLSTQAARVELEQLRGPLLDLLRLAAAELSAVLGGYRPG